MLDFTNQAILMVGLMMMENITQIGPRTLNSQNKQLKHKFLKKIGLAEAKQARSIESLNHHLRLILCFKQLTLPSAGPYQNQWIASSLYNDGHITIFEPIQLEPMQRLERLSETISLINWAKNIWAREWAKW